MRLGDIITLQVNEENAELKARIKELEADNRKLRYEYFNSPDYMTLKLSLPEPPEDNWEQGQ